MQWTSEEKQEWLDYVFQHNYNRVEQAAKRLEEKGGQFSLNISSKKGEASRSEYTVPDDDATMEFGLAIARFALPDTRYNIDQWLKFLRDLAGEKHTSEFDKMERRLQQTREGGMALTLNQEKITDSKAYEMLARGVVFAGDLVANAYKQELLKHGQIIYHILWEKYNSYCLGLWHFLQEVHDYRKKYGIRPAPIKRETICIYCKGTAGDFGHVEHIIPESLGNEYIFLPKGFVCGDCMAELNKLEEGINEMSPFSMVLVTTSTGNKKGKLPSLKSPELHIQKKSPNELIFRSFGKKDEFKEEPVESGGYKITITPSGRLDAHRIARMLYKAVLGAIALEKGRDAALDPKFDELRRYIIKGGTFPNKMMLSKKGHPSLHMEVELYEVEGVPKVKFVVLGFIFTIILGEKPKLDPVDELQTVIMLDLSLEKPETAVEQTNVESKDSKK
jgi:hypothetical protein